MQMVSAVATPARFIKTLVYQLDGGAAIAVLVRGDHELSETKLGQVLGGQDAVLADAQTVERVTGAPVGFAGPVGLDVRVLADLSLRGLKGAISGANRADEHVAGVDLARDRPDATYHDLRRARQGDACPRCGSADTERLSAFGSTACKALYRCIACREPFEQFKPI